MTGSKVAAAMVSLSLALSVAAERAGADSISYQDAVGLLTTDWTRTAQVPKFDPGLGSLIQIVLEITAMAERSYAFENLDAKEALITMRLAGSVQMQAPDLSLLTAAFPEVYTADAVTAFDTTLDFAGSSGKTYAPAQVAAWQNRVLTAPLSLADEAAFVGASGLVSLPVHAEATAYATGPGNLYALFGSKASATVTVTYEYTPVPEPGAIAVVAWVPAYWLLRRRRRLNAQGQV